MKKFFAVFLALFFILGIVGCNDTSENKDQKTTSTNENVTSSSKDNADDNEGIKLADGTIIYREGAISDKAIIEFKDEQGNVLLTADDVLKVSAKYIETSGYVIQLDFTEDGTEKFKAICEKNIGKTLSIYIDDKLMFAPVVQGVITDGKVIITNYDFDKEEILKLYDSLT